MMRIPSASTPISWSDIRQGLKVFFNKGSWVSQFEQAICQKFGHKYCFAFSSGTVAFYVALKALQQLSAKIEVILPAYTAPHLILAILKAGLKPVLCDVSLSTFNLDAKSLANQITGQTLCIVPVHMFGIPCQLEPVIELARSKAIFVFEDSASALGAQLNGKNVGALGDVNIYSFNRGKNMSTFCGGCVTTSSEDIAQALQRQLTSLPPPDRLAASLLPMKTIALSLAMRPLVYTLLYPLIAQFKDTKLHTEFDVKPFTDFQAAVGLSLLERRESLFRIRRKNGLLLHEGLKNIEGIRLAEIISGSLPVFNQFPVVFKDKIARDALRRRLLGEGIEATVLYPEPIHHVYDLGYDKDSDPFPNASFIADRILLLPVHPLVSEDKLKIAIRLFKELK
jgi:dTDP-4-amino-4,6-dideoxygalactose transaminase